MSVARRARLLFLAAICGVAGCATTPGPLPHVVIVGDSTASAYGPERYPRTGWGMVLGCGLESSVGVDNRAQSGRSTKSYIDEGRWTQALALTEPGDVMLIQFGHNDEKSDDPSRFTDAHGAFQDNLRRFIGDVRARRAIPILLTPVARRAFRDGATVDTHGDYDDAVRAVAAETHTLLIDLAADSMAFLAATGEENSRRYYLHFTAADGVAAYPQGVNDDTHFSEAGARAMAGLVIRRLAELPTPLKRYVHPDAPALQPGFRAGGPGCAAVQNVPG